LSALRRRRDDGPGQGFGGAFRCRRVGAAAPVAHLERRCAVFGLIVSGRHGLGESQERAMSHQPPKESKKKAQHTAKEKKAIKQQKKHAGDAVPLIKH
jgi:hypothetical protein